MDEHARLSKSKYLAGRQCARRLWLQCRAPELAGEPGAGAQAILDAGTAIGLRAHALFPGGVLVDEHAFEAAATRTQALLAEPGVPAVFEAAFERDGVRIRVDVLERLGGGTWGLREVKSSTRVKDVHLDDVAVQRWVLEGCGLAVPSVELIHVDAGYVRAEHGVDWERFFARRDVSVAAAARAPAIPAFVGAMHATLALAAAPAIEPSPHCWSPYACEFWAHCTRAKPDDWVLHLPRLSAERLGELREAGIERIPDIPDDFPLLMLQARVREVLRSGGEFVSADLGAALAGLGPPADYLDFETTSPGIPLYAGTRPYERIPFQWSLHRADAVGGVVHYAFLADGRADPRRAFAESLLDALGGETPILVYSSFEGGVLADLAALFPDLAGALEAVHGRLRDLLPIVRRHVYHRDFRSSFSVKSVAPALAPGFGYGDLAGIAGGDEAAFQFARVAVGACDADEEARLREALLAYCRRDTEALRLIHAALRARAGG